MGRPVVFVHGLWMLPSSWQAWLDLFASKGYAPRALEWPGDSATVEEARQHPERIAGRGIGEIVEHLAVQIRALPEPPVIIGHSFGALFTQMLLGKGLGAGAIAITPAQSRGVLPMPLAQLGSVGPFLLNPANYKRALMHRRFQKCFAGAVSEAEAKELEARYAVPAPIRPLFEVGFANLNWGTAAKVNIKAQRGPLLIIAGGKDKLVPEVISRSSHKRYRGQPTINDYKLFPDRGHSLALDSGWREIADASLEWLASKGLSA